MKQHSINKQITLDFYAKVLGQGDTSLVHSIVSDNYIQHSPTVKTGKVGFLEFMDFLKQLPQAENQSKPFMRFICDDNFVAVHLDIEFMGQRKSVLDLYRLENGFLAEHWDASEDVTPLSVNGNSVVEGTIRIENLESTKENKSIVGQYCQQVLMAKPSEKWDNYLAVDLIQHNPQVKNGRTELIAYYEKLEILNVHRVIGEGNFVLTQSEGSFHNATFVIYDIYRLKHRMIVEHWSVKQVIPNALAYSNGMV